MTEPRKKQKSNISPAKPVEVVAPIKWPKGCPQQLRDQLLQWYHQKGRHKLPWLATVNTTGLVNDYYVAVSEVMMQQTTVAVGLKRFPLWIDTFPTWNDLAQASSEDVMKAWEGLGYYSRARSLHQMAKDVVSLHQGVLPKDRLSRLQLKGVGPTTASAFGAFVYGLREPIWDANVNRVWKRWWGKLYPNHTLSKNQKQWEWNMAQEAMPETAGDIRLWTQAVMDLGATVCTPKNPQCSICPFKTSCYSAKHGVDETVTAKPQLVRQKLVKKWVWIVDNNRVAVVPPTEKGIWAGLWQLPECIHNETSLNAHNSNQHEQVLADGLHKLSHRDVYWSVQTGVSSDIDSTNVQWIDVKQWTTLALPKPLRHWTNTSDFEQIENRNKK